MRNLIGTAVAGFLLLPVIGVGSAAGWTIEEHQKLTNDCLHQVISEYRIDFPFDSPIRGDMNFGEVSAWSARDDGDPKRNHRRGMTIQQQLSDLKRETIEAFLAEHAEDRRDADPARWPPVVPVETGIDNVICNYLVHHLIALHLSEQAGRTGGFEDEVWRRALCFEAIAQGFLADAFSSSHMLARETNLLTWLHPFNTKLSHDHYRNFGLYVMDSCGDIWQTFGDGLMYWFSATLTHVQGASLWSLRELMLVYFLSHAESELPLASSDWCPEPTTGASGEAMVRHWLQVRDGVEYYSVMKMPALVRLPMIMTAAWRLKQGEKERNGIRRARYFLQFREEGLHDPDLGGIDLDFLYSRSAVPDWLVFPELETSTPASLIRSNKDVASVRFIQDRSKPPSFMGGLLIAGVGYMGRGTTFEFTPTYGVGFGLVDEFIPFRRLPNLCRISLEITYQPSVAKHRRKILSPSLAFQIHVPRKVRFHFETGFAYGLESPYTNNGVFAAIGLCTPTVPLGFTYIGFITRLKYKVLYVDEVLGGVFLEIVLH